MSLGLAFWILMLLWLAFGAWQNWNAGSVGPWGWGGSLLQFLLFVLLGWKVFGAPLHG